MKNIVSIQKIRDSISVNKDKIIAQHSTWNPVIDARITVFSKLINVCNSTQLSFTFIQHHLTKADWWKQIYKSQISVQDLKSYENEFNMFIKMGFIQFTFSSVESAFRLYVKSLDSSACNNGTAAFKNIYSWLLNKTNLQVHENLLDLLRLVRNTIHNNGVYFHKSGLNDSIIYKGKTYNFINGNPVNFVTWGFLFYLIKDLENLLVKVIESNVINSIEQINDPYANNVST